jgi:beta-lactamase superfamily II metal-dependent hydrolase
VTDALQVRIYNVRFGDAILVSVPDRKGDGTTSIHHVLIDFGNALSTQGGDDSVFEPVARDILQVLDGRPVDLYVMTHEHMDHVQGLKFAAERLNIHIPIKRVWLTKSAEPGYYDTHEDSKVRRLEAAQAYLMIRRFLAAAPASGNPTLEIMMRNNDVMLREDAPSADATLAAAGAASSTAAVRGLHQERRPGTALLCVSGARSHRTPSSRKRA